jgi:hypothetical protein
MANFVGGVLPVAVSSHDEEARLVREASLPLYQARGWLKFVGIMLILGGIPSIFVLVGIIPIWQGILLMQAASSLETASNTGQAFALHSALNNIKTFFVVNGVFIIIGMIFALIMICLSIVLPLVGISLIPFLDATNYY